MSNRITATVRFESKKEDISVEVSSWDVGKAMDAAFEAYKAKHHDRPSGSVTLVSLVRVEA
jgi:hypothetical protein